MDRDIQAIRGGINPGIGKGRRPFPQAGGISQEFPVGYKLEQLVIHFRLTSGIGSDIFRRLVLFKREAK
jgi:hypothetical protein